MQKKYRLYHLTDLGKADMILREISQLEGIHSVRITEDLQILDVDAEDAVFRSIMDSTVNICRRVSQDCELTYLF